MTTDLLFNTLFTITWQSAMLAAAVGIIIVLFGRRLQPRFRYLLWSVVLLRLALPILPTMPWTYPQVALYNTSNPQVPASTPPLTALWGSQSTAPPVALDDVAQSQRTTSVTPNQRAASVGGTPPKLGDYFFFRLTVCLNFMIARLISSDVSKSDSSRPP